RRRPPAALGAEAPRLIHNHRVDGVACVPGPANTVRARVRVWMSVVNHDGLGEWADHMEAKVRLEATTAGVNYTRKWVSQKTPYLIQDKRHAFRMNLLSDNLSGSADWRVHIKLIWHRPAPIKNITRHIYKPFRTSCADPTGGISLPATPALPSAGAGG
ncbi:MAG: hypothetical protein Q8M03_13665, partial [Legionella sp.]|nr:hypothetical protein [Legionella sp.]